MTVAERPLSQGSGGEPEQAVTSAPRISWPEFQAYLSDHWVPKSTPHVSIISQNGGGKTYLVGRGLLPMLDDERVLFVDTKHDDDEINRIGMIRVKKVPTRMERRLHYRHKKPRDQWFQLMVTTRDQVAAAIRTCVAEGGWVIVLDEERTITDRTPYFQPRWTCGGYQAPWSLARYYADRAYASSILRQRILLQPGASSIHRLALGRSREAEARRDRRRYYRDYGDSVAASAA